MCTLMHTWKKPSFLFPHLQEELSLSFYGKNLRRWKASMVPLKQSSFEKLQYIFSQRRKISYLFYFKHIQGSVDLERMGDKSRKKIKKKEKIPTKPQPHNPPMEENTHTKIIIKKKKHNTRSVVGKRDLMLSLHTPK